MTTALVKILLGNVPERLADPVQSITLHEEERDAYQNAWNDIQEQFQKIQHLPKFIDNLVTEYETQNLSYRLLELWNRGVSENNLVTELPLYSIRSVSVPEFQAYATRYADARESVIESIANDPDGEVYDFIAEAADSGTPVYYRDIMNTFRSMGDVEDPDGLLADYLQSTSDPDINDLMQRAIYTTISAQLSDEADTLRAEALDYDEFEPDNPIHPSTLLLLQVVNQITPYFYSEENLQWQAYRNELLGWIQLRTTWQTGIELGLRWRCPEAAIRHPELEFHVEERFGRPVVAEIPEDEDAIEEAARAVLNQIGCTFVPSDVEELEWEIVDVHPDPDEPATEIIEVPALVVRNNTGDTIYFTLDMTAETEDDIIPFPVPPPEVEEETEEYQAWRRAQRQRRRMESNYTPPRPPGVGRRQRYFRRRR